MTINTTEPRWKDIKKIMNKFEKKQLLDQLSDLYRLSTDNKDFFHARFSIGEDPLGPYRRIIQNAIQPQDEENEVSDFEKANDAISQYSKAVDNPKGEAELRIFYVECGNLFSLENGDMDRNRAKKRAGMGS